MSRIILASGSPYRKELLQRLQIAFDVLAPDVDETVGDSESPSDLVNRLALLKASTVADKFPDAIIIGSDQVAVCEGRVLGKPGTLDNARQQLTFVSGKRITFYTGLCVLNAATLEKQCDEVTFIVEFRELSDEMIQHYLAKEPALNCAGAFKSEGLGIALTERMIGDDITALVGLPLIHLTRMLENLGVKII